MRLIWGLAVVMVVLSLQLGESAKHKGKTKKAKKSHKDKDSGGVDGDLADVVDTFVDEEDLDLWTTTTLEDIKNSTSCSDLGYADLSQYQYLYPIDAKYTQADGSSDKLFLPILSSHNLDTKNKNVKKVLFAVHGKEGDVDTYFCLAKYAADLYALRHGKEKDEVAVIAPWFSEEQNTGEDWAGDNAKSSYKDHMSVYWGSSNWISSANDGCNVTSTFDTLDSLVATSLNPKVFPHAKRVSFVGFSAGGQVVARYAWANSLSLSGSDSSDTEVESIRYIVSDPSSYLYLTPERPEPSCIPLYDTGYSSNTEHNYCRSFSSDTTTVPDIADCSDYDTWKYGVGAFEDTASYSYFSDFAGDADLVTKQSTKLRSKDVRYIFGTADTCNCNTEGYVNPTSADSVCFPTDSDGNSLSCSPNDGGTSGCCDTYPGSTNNELSTSCGAELQGYNRMQRGLVYMSYLSYLWSNHDYAPKYSLVEGLSHDAETMYKSDVLGTWAFSDDDEQEELETTEDVVVISLDSLSTSSRGSGVVAGASEQQTRLASTAISSHVGGQGLSSAFWVFVGLTACAVGAYVHRAIGTRKPPANGNGQALVTKIRLDNAI